MMIRTLNKHNPKYELDYSRSVDVYRNLHKNCYSIKQDGLVKAHAQKLSLEQCTFHVNEKGRDRVRKTKRKEVHAWVRGRLSNESGAPIPYNRIHYNPYETDQFVHLVPTGAMSSSYMYIERADLVTLLPEGLYKS